MFPVNKQSMGRHDADQGRRSTPAGRTGPGIGERPVTPWQSAIVAMSLFLARKGPDDTLLPRFAWTPSAPCDKPLFRPADRVDRRRITTPGAADEEKLPMRLRADLALDRTDRASQFVVKTSATIDPKRGLECASVPLGVG